MRGVLAVDEAFCLISHRTQNPRDSHAPRTRHLGRAPAARAAAGPRAGAGPRRAGGRGGFHSVSCIDALPASNAGVGVALVGSAASRSGAGAGGGTSSVERRDPRDAPRRSAGGAGGRPARSEADGTARAPAPGRRTPSGQLMSGLRLCERRHRKIKDIYEINSS
jgi:hypothetical protein